MTEAELKAMQQRVKEKAQGTEQQPFCAVVKAKGKTQPRDRGMNGEERKYAAHLEAEKRADRILFYDFECMKIRLSDTSGYSPDFMVMDCDGHIIFVDVKAYWKKQGKPGITEDSLQKMKNAGEKYPMFTFKAVWCVDGVWHERVF